MEKVSDFFKEVKERLSSPLLYSFLFSWFVINWKIIVGLFFYKINDIKLDGYNSYIDLISKNISVSNTLLKPLLIALLYTFIFPFIRNIILGFNSWIKAWGNTWNLKISKSSKVSIGKYIELREIYQKRTLLLENILEKESKYLTENEELRNTNLQLSAQFNSTNEELQKLKSLNDPRVLDGSWEYSYKLAVPNEKYIEKVFILSGRISFPDNPSQKTEIRNFFYNPSTNQMSFIGVNSENDKMGKNIQKYHYYNFDVLDNLTLLKGFENEERAVQYKKVG